MIIKKIHLKNFRNYQSIDLSFNHKFNLIIGKNAQGKTNLIEALYFVSQLSSFRTSNRNELIGTGFESAQIESDIDKDGLDHHVRIEIFPQRKVVTHQGKFVRKTTEYLEVCPSLLFEPQDVYLFRATPSQRRSFLNHAVFLSDPASMSYLSEYKEIIQQKNRLLKDSFQNPSFDDLVSVWNEKLVQTGTRIICDRLRWLDEMNNVLPDQYNSIASHKSERARLTYKSSVVTEGNNEPKTIQHNLREKLKEKYGEEKRRQESLVGPHRDDISFYLGERELQTMGSQGENRSAIISIKSAQIELFKEKFGVPPLFFLDDVLSELDAARSEKLFDLLKNMSGQVFLSTTEMSEIPSFFSRFGTTFLVENATISVLQNTHNF